MDRAVWRLRAPVEGACYIIMSTASHRLETRNSTLEPFVELILPISTALNNERKDAFSLYANEQNRALGTGVNFPIRAYTYHISLSRPLHVTHSDVTFIRGGVVNFIGENPGIAKICCGQNTGTRQQAQHRARGRSRPFYIGRTRNIHSCMVVLELNLDLRPR